MRPAAERVPAKIQPNSLFVFRLESMAASTRGGGEGRLEKSFSFRALEIKQGKKIWWKALVGYSSYLLLSSGERPINGLGN